MDSLELCNGIRMESEGVIEKNIPLDCLPTKIQDMVLMLSKQENYSIEYTMASLLIAASSAIGNSTKIHIRGGWKSSPILYMILVGRPGMGKTPPLDFAYHPIRKHDSKIIKQFKLDLENYNSTIESMKGKKENDSSLPPKPVLKRTILSDFTPEALIRALDDNKRGVVIYVDEIMGMFNSVNQYSKGQLIEQLLTIFSGKPLDVSRCGMPYPIRIDDPFVTLVGTMQTTRVHELVSKGYKDNGLMDRIIFEYPSSQHISDWQIDEDDSSVWFDKYASLWESIINRLLELPFQENGPNSILRFSDDAKVHFTNWRNSMTRPVNEIENDNLVDSRIFKSPLITARMALVIQMLRWACGESHKDNVDIDSVKSAIRLTEYFEGCYKRIEVFMNSESLTPQKKDLLDYLPEKFTTSNAIKAGKEVGLSERSVMYTLSELSKTNIIRKIRHGEYEKLQ